MIKSILSLASLSIGTPTSENSKSRSSSPTSSSVEDQDSSAAVPPDSSSSGSTSAGTTSDGQETVGVADLPPPTTPAATQTPSTASPAPEVAIATPKPSSEIQEGRKDGFDEHIIREIVKEYGQVERLTPFRIKIILKSALRETKPPPPDPSECCGCSCTPCVKDLWREEVLVWKLARNIDPYALDSKEDDEDQDKNLDW